AVLSVGGVGLDLLLRQQRTMAVAIVFGFAVTFVLGWVALGQNASHLGTFISRALITSQGYGKAMGYEGSPELRWRGIVVTVATAVTILVRASWSFPNCLSHLRSRQVILAAWLLAALFLVWKHGFVRTDLYHVGFFFGLVPILALGLEIMPTRNAASRFWARV